MNCFPLLYPSPGCTFHIQETVEIRQRDAAIHRISPVGELIIRIKSGVEVLFAIFKLHKETEKARQW